jgi:hypothetical protein
MEPPEGGYRRRYQTFDLRRPCGLGCLYNCCDPVITYFNIQEGADLAARLEECLPAECSRIQQMAPFLEFVAVSLPELPAIPGIDTAPPPPGRVQVNLLWSCPHLAGGLCAIHDRPRPGLCTAYVHCPEHFIDELDEERFLELARSYGRLRRQVVACAAPTVEEGLVRRKAKETIFLYKENKNY